ncbi:hypothetical protein A3A14_03180 [Candidatus Daviesbacteria bacterium RIFCSPLOWO2_01_FULL_43_38]|uniref:DUF1003 domain-containing protein n=1 Tax=Candidatus Daviesbacteria bacterium RIFCSPHIGHO2_12_FULL_43_11 TaxID=1797780 RepID=A0A1F5JZT8_9BACT|nr:MAG: hypothetical protein A2874_01130 [Candidatus Daviesbacteria bacterium RIFCSPHIGHO2_01_FULL_43_17]OGE34154.1 MAG: hypothetical protein A3E45_01830 [Candidatus Daviesbacteria bacterium RIFCSPHIGHO2_12_FULL_43_11]OGE63483.1 MAG: hypothetical protein A3A14_03180 [Candidatus Daviesbacteria bacterium RIFCSPLOWO2_01_FULL_43_38]OGE70831.1 MAG: hypothetical protein A3J21_01045 [Candidatus Daviesbacteria bacterium RIFCSPLOWO2_02_FULL_43_11]
METNSFQRHVPENINIKHRQTLGFHDRVALSFTKLIGTMYAVYTLVLFLAGWMLWQSVDTNAFDPYPFAFLLFIGNVMQLLLIPLIIVSQNLQSKHAELRAEEEYKRTVSIYNDIGKILEKLK